MSKQLATVKQSDQVSAHIVIASIEKKAKRNFTKLENAFIGTKQEYEEAALLLKELKAYKKEAEFQEATITTPLKKAYDAAKALFKPFYTKVDTIEQLTKTAMLDFIAEQDAKIKKLEAKFNDGKIKKVNTLLDKTAEHTIISGAASVRTTRELVIINEKLIPREYLIPDTAKIKTALKEGKTVAGCKMEDKKGLAI